MWRRAWFPKPPSGACEQPHRAARRRTCEPPACGPCERRSDASNRAVMRAVARAIADRTAPAPNSAPSRSLRMPRSGLCDRQWLRRAGASPANSILRRCKAIPPLAEEGLLLRRGCERILLSSSVDAATGLEWVRSDTQASARWLRVVQVDQGVRTRTHTAPRQDGYRRGEQELPQRGPPGPVAWRRFF